MDSAKLCALAAAAALVFGCSSSSRERVQGGAPLFESNVRTDEVHGGPVPTGRPVLNTAPVPHRASLSDVTGPIERSTFTVPEAAAAEPKPPAGTTSGQQVRQRICDDLRRGASMEAEETNDGARLWLHPASRADALRLRKTADDLAETAAANDTTTVPTTTCALYQLVASGADLRVTALEDGAIRIDVSASERGIRGYVRAEVERFARTAR